MSSLSLLPGMWCSVPPAQGEKRYRVGVHRRPCEALHKWGLKAAFSWASLSTEVPSAHVVWFMRDRVLSHGNGDKLATVIHQDVGFSVFVAKSFGNMGWVAVCFV